MDIAAATGNLIAMIARTLYLHIGLPKTGSTFLQQQLFSKLNDMKVVSMPSDSYFHDGSSTANSGNRLLGSIFRRSDTVWQHEPDRLLDHLLGSGWQEDERDILLSDEAIGRQASRQGLFAAHLVAMQDALHRRGIEQMKILCLFRRQDHWLMSHYVQMSDRNRHAGQADADAFIRRTCDPRQNRFTFGALLDYAAILTAVSQVVADEDRVFLPMEWLRTDSRRIGRQLAMFLDREEQSFALSSADQENVRRIGKDRWQLRQPPPLARLRNVLVRRCGHVTLNPDMSRLALETYRACNRQLEHQTGIALAPLGYFAQG
ncbi:hypothetical protein RM533_06705 [Croceicoccus sp. F390]|uniref:Sulfotransferase family protein n=1 Tax=Croceicoccus esteveae TaxID=3075597 RepID=A0ABU2ZI42_9SPHN|nr:hypothetical protein [Croceicoccus sp. F390]MDT0575871.1 hypothetical protein [Croceicoccus sp. F390]